MQALIDAWRAGQFGHAQINTVISDRKDAKALERASQNGITAHFLDPKAYANRETFDTTLIKILTAAKTDLVCLAGYMRILSVEVVRHFPNKIMNIHPALLPSFGGHGMYGHFVHEAVLKSGVKYSGCTVHFVDKGTDTGPIILQAVVPVLDHDTPESLAERVLIEEHRLFSRAVSLYCENRLQIEGQRVIINERA